MQIIRIHRERAIKDLPTQYVRCESIKLLPRKSFTPIVATHFPLAHQKEKEVKPKVNKQGGGEYSIGEADS